MDIQAKQNLIKLRELELIKIRKGKSSISTTTRLVVEIERLKGEIELLQKQKPLNND
jgi:hypothetical protein